MSDQILDKIRKILAKAEDAAATREEAETYTAKAAELIAAYGVDRALLAAREPESDAVGDRVVMVDPPYALDKATLLGEVAHRLRCRAVQRTTYGDRAKHTSLHLFGYESDLRRAELLYTSLLLQATAALTGSPVPYGEHAAAFRRSWLAGFTMAIGARLADAERRAAQDAEAAASCGGGGRDAPAGRSVSLVLADRDAVVARILMEHYPTLRRTSGRRLSGGGVADGWHAGQRADLGGTTLGDHARGAIGA